MPNEKEVIKDQETSGRQVWRKTPMKYKTKRDPALSARYVSTTQHRFDEGVRRTPNRIILIVGKNDSWL